jgi:hypothetical protein
VVVLVVTVPPKTLTVESTSPQRVVAQVVAVLVVVMVTALLPQQVLLVLEIMVLVAVAVHRTHTAVKVAVEQEEVDTWQFDTQTVMEPLHQSAVDLHTTQQLTGLTECTNLQVVQEL